MCCACELDDQHASLGVAFYMFCCGLLFKAGDLDTDATAFQIITATLLLSVGGFAVLAVVVRGHRVA